MCLDTGRLACSPLVYTHLKLTLSLHDGMPWLVGAHSQKEVSQFRDS